MPGYFENKKRDKWYFNGIKIGQGHFNGELVYQSAFAVTYRVDTANVYTEAIVPGTSVLNPTTFTPKKSGWTFKGWRQDNTASADVETALTAKEPITLYAVFEQDITCTFKSYNSSKTDSGKRYYNNGNVTNASVKVPTGASYSGWTWRGWSAAGVSNANASVSHANGATISGISENRTFYGLYEQTISCTFKSYNKSETSSGIRYYSASGNSTTASVKVPTGASYSGWTWRGWSAANSTGASGSVAYSNGSTITGLTSGYTYYGLYQRTLTLSYAGNGATGGSTASQTGTQYWTAAGNYSHPSFTLRSNGFSLAYYGFVNWAMGSAGGTRYSAGASVTLSANATFYAIWDQNDAYATITGQPFELYDTGWEDSYWKSLSVTPNNSVFFSIASDGKYIQVNKSCTVRANISITNGGGWGSYAITNGSSTIWEISVGEYGEISTTTESTTLSLSAGTKLYARAGSRTAGDGITFTFDSITLTLDVA